jgi:3-hydroxyacyl-CoA dehydrogenase/enoyl-CoA hydratase/3-hydroxybutyryl-CoA epimerase
MTDFTYDLAPDGVATITWDVPGRSMNVMSMAGFAELEALIDQALGDAACKGIILTSGKKDFAGGMDLAVLAKMREGGAEGVFHGIMETHRFLRKIERAGMDPKTLKGAKPIVCAMPGTGLGIGFEIPLACHRIIAADNDRAKIGLPEILVGIFPGAGGTTRLIRKMGVMLAAPFLMEGKLLSPRLAKAEGLIDEVVPADQLLARARDWVLSAKEADLVKPWDQKGYKLPGGAPYHPSGFQTFVGANAMILGKTQGCYPAAQALLQAAYEGTLVPFDTALRIEARAFTSVLLDPSSSAMIRSLFLNKEALEKGARRPALPDESVRHLGVIGAGMMGAGIAHVAALAGIEVTLIDATEEAAQRGKAQSEALLEKSVQRRKITPEKKAEVLARLTPTTDYAALGSCDLVIEAVFEDPGIKAEVTAKIEAAIPEGCIVATNTSTLPIKGLARASQRPGQYLGIHFFSPVDKMALVEIIRGPETEDRAVAKAMDLVRALKKTPIVVNDARFFYANRCIIPYINEGLRMVAEGIPPALIENAARMIGMPLGPLQLVDETSLELGLKIAKATRAAMGESYPDGAVDEVLNAMAAEGRLGRKVKAGFYAYDETGKRLDLWEGLGRIWPATQRPEVQEVQDRLLMIQALEAVRAREAGVLEDVREGDVGAILGWGFAPWSGGPFAWLDRIGPDKALAVAERLSGLGPRFAPPALLRQMAAEDGRFYPRAA